MSKIDRKYQRLQMKKEIKEVAKYKERLKSERPTTLQTSAKPNK